MSEHWDRARGFTLLEMLVALSVFSIAALTLIRLDAFAIRTVGDLDARALAQIVAQNDAVMLRTDAAPPVVGTSTTRVRNGGRDWRVVRSVAKTADPDLLRVDIVVEGEGMGATRAALTVIRPAA
jgi:general secretion pathway protein I